MAIAYSVHSVRAQGGKADIVLTKSVDKTSVNAGDTLTYSIAYKNNGSVKANNLVISDVVPTGTTYVGGSASNGGGESGGTVKWNIGTVNPGASSSVNFKVTVNGTSSGGGTSSNNNTSNNNSTSNNTNNTTNTNNNTTNNNTNNTNNNNTNNQNTNYNSGTIDTSCPVGTHLTYEVGPGKQYTTLGSVPWSTLGAGDSVRIYDNNGAPYHEKIFISTSGTAAAHLTICGVLGPNGERPMIYGDNATTNSQFASYSTVFRQPYGVMYIGAVKYATIPSYLEIKNLDIANTSAGTTYTDTTGATVPYVQGAAPIYVYRIAHSQLINLELHNGSNGLFINTGNTSNDYSQDVLVAGSYIHGNGVAGVLRQHNVYSEAFNIVFQYNHFGYLIDGSLGSNLKDRSGATTIRYNWFEGGAHIMDLVDEENASPYFDTLPGYYTSYVYGNTIIDPPGVQGTGTFHGSSLMIHFGQDTGVSVPTHSRRDLYFFNNTLANYSDGTGANSRFRSVIFQVTDSVQNIHAWNNIFYNTNVTAGVSASQLNLQSAGPGNGDYGVNWINMPWSQCASNGTCTGTINGIANILSNAVGANPGFADASMNSFDPHLTSGSANINKGQANDANALNYTVDHQYIKHQGAGARTVNGGTIDLGAFEF